MEVSLLKYPTEEDWKLVKRAALTTVDKTIKTPPSLTWEKSILEARHSPIRMLHFVFELREIPYWVSVHLCRHVHAVPFVRSQRNDRQDKYDRNGARQDAPVNMMWEMNAEELCVIANKRLCKMAAKETQEAVSEMWVQWELTITLYRIGHQPESRSILANPLAVGCSASSLRTRLGMILRSSGIPTIR